MKTLPTCAALLLPALALHGATIRGMVIENQTGHPLARATVTLQVAGRPAALTQKTTPNGSFAFSDLPAGSYLISASRPAFAPVQYGQRRWQTPGVPIAIESSDAPPITIRLPRYGAISGTLLDENDVALPEHDVAVYSNSRPPRLLAHTQTDDRGLYRLFGLQPGNYLVRALAKLYEDGGYLPTFYRDSQTVDQTRAVPVKLDEEVEHIDIRPAPGRLFTITGRVTGLFQALPAVALSSDTGTVLGAIDRYGAFTFKPTAPGSYELLARTTDRSGNTLAAFLPFTLDRDLSDVRLQLAPLPTLQFSFEDTEGRPIAPRDLTLVARRRDPAGERLADVIELPFDNTAVPLLPGHWSISVAPSERYCAIDAQAWREVLLHPNAPAAVKFILSTTPANLSGTVKNAAGAATADMPVYLEYLNDIRATRTDANGQYQFIGLAPGAYRILATFDYQPPELAEMKLGTAVAIESGAKSVMDLEELQVK